MRKTIYTALAAAAATIAISSPASAKKLDSLDCSAVTFNVTTVDCLGFFGDPQTIAEGGPQLDLALDYTKTLDAGATSLLEKIDTGNDPTKLFGNTIDFDTVLSGLTVIGLHFGGGNTGYNGTAFWLLNVPTGTDSITWSSTVQQGISAAGLYSTGVVPEPATWAMMIAGFGLTGAAMRRRKTRVAVTYA